MIRSIFVTVRTSPADPVNIALAQVGGKPSVELLVERLKYSKKADSIVLCTTHRKEDWVLSNIASNLGVLCSQGSTDDILERWMGATIEYDVDFFVSVEGADIFCDPVLLDQAFDQFERTKADVIEGKGLVRGAFGLGISTKALKQISALGTAYELTDVMRLLRAVPEIVHETLQGAPPALLGTTQRLTLENQEDLPLVSRVFEELGVARPNISVQEILAHLAR